VVVRFDVVPGPQYRLAKIDLGDIAGTGADYETLRAAFGVRVGDPVNTEKILKGRADLAATLGDNGYAFAKVGEPALVIDHEPRTGDLTVPVTSGGRYVFGQVVSGMPRFMGSRHIQHIARSGRAMSIRPPCSTICGRRSWRPAWSRRSRSRRAK
jgi:translocation and assembly module TamA